MIIIKGKKDGKLIDITHVDMGEWPILDKGADTTYQGYRSHFKWEGGELYTVIDKQQVITGGSRARWESDLAQLKEVGFEDVTVE